MRGTSVTNSAASSATARTTTRIHRILLIKRYVSEIFAISVLTVFLQISLRSAELRRRTAMMRRRFVRRRDSEQQRFVEGPGDEIDTDRQRHRYRTDEPRAGAVGGAIPDRRRESGRDRNGRKSLL